MKTILFSILLSSALCFSQESIKGKIIDSGNGGTLAYVNIGIKDQGVGTVSNRNGQFLLELDQGVNVKERVIFSHIGFVQQEHSVSSLIGKNNIISMIPEPTLLNEVVVKPKAPKSKKLGRRGKGFGLMHHNFYSAHEKDIDDRLSKEMGMGFSLGKDCMLDALNFNITSNDFNTVKFRVNVYKITNGMPDGPLNTQDIIFEVVDGKLGWFKVDLISYGIYLEKELKKIVVSIQWLESVKMAGRSKYFSISTAMGTSKNFFYRDKAMDRWSKGKSKLSFYLDAACN